MGTTTVINIMSIPYAHYYSIHHSIVHHYLMMINLMYIYYQEYIYVNGVIGHVVILLWGVWMIGWIMLLLDCLMMMVEVMLVVEVMMKRRRTMMMRGLYCSRLVNHVVVERIVHTTINLYNYSMICRRHNINLNQ